MSSSRLEKLEEEFIVKQKKTHRKQKSSSSLSRLNDYFLDDDRIYQVPDFDKDNKNAIKTLKYVSLVCLLFMLTEIFGGFFANSLAIMTDAAHLFSDISGFFISIFSLRLSSLPSDRKMSFGYYRAEVIGSLASVMIIQGLTIWLVFEAVQRLLHPPQINASIMLVISILGLIFNLIMMKILHSSHGHGHDHSSDHTEMKTVKKDGNDDLEDQLQSEDDSDHDHENMNIRAALIHLIGDTVQSVGVIISALVIFFCGQDYAIADPICTFLFSIIVMVTTVPLTKECINVLMEGTPLSFKVDDLKKKLLTVEGVSNVHDLHVWSLGPKQVSMSTHLVSTQPSLSLVRATQMCKKFKIFHTVIQVENSEDSHLYNLEKCKEYSHN